MLLIQECFQALETKGAGSCRRSSIFSFFVTSLEIRKIVLQECKYGYFWCKMATTKTFVHLLYINEINYP